MQRTQGNQRRNGLQMCGGPGTGLPFGLPQSKPIDEKSQGERAEDLKREGSRPDDRINGIDQGERVFQEVQNRHALGGNRQLGDVEEGQQGWCSPIQAMPRRAEYMGWSASVTI